MSNYVKIYDVNTYHNLGRQSTPFDGIDHHHIPQQRPASEVIKGYTRNNGVSIALPKEQHQKLHRLTRPFKAGEFNGTPRELLARDIQAARKAGIPNSVLKEVIKQNKQIYQEAFKKQDIIRKLDIKQQSFKPPSIKGIGYGMVLNTSNAILKNITCQSEEMKYLSDNNILNSDNGVRAQSYCSQKHTPNLYFYPDKDITIDRLTYYDYDSIESTYISKFSGGLYRNVIYPINYVGGFIYNYFNEVNKAYASTTISPPVTEFTDVNESTSMQMKQPFDTYIDEIYPEEEIILPVFNKDEQLDFNTQNFIDNFTESFSEVKTDEIQTELSFPDEDTIHELNFDITDYSNSMNTAEEVLNIANQIKNFKNLSDEQKTKLIVGTVLQKCTDSRFNLNLSPNDSVALQTIGNLLTTQKLRVEDVGAIIVNQQLGIPCTGVKELITAIVKDGDLNKAITQIAIDVITYLNPYAAFAYTVYNCINLVKNLTTKQYTKKNRWCECNI